MPVAYAILALCFMLSALYAEIMALVNISDIGTFAKDLGLAALAVALGFYCKYKAERELKEDK